MAGARVADQRAGGAACLSPLDRIYIRSVAGTYSAIYTVCRWHVFVSCLPPSTWAKHGLAIDFAVPAATAAVGQYKLKVKSAAHVYRARVYAADVDLPQPQLSTSMQL